MSTFVDNKYFVGVMGNRVSIMMPPTGYMSSDEALNLAAWLVAVCMSIPGSPDFDEVLKGVLGT